MASAGLGWREILAALTTTPARVRAGVGQGFSPGGVAALTACAKASASPPEL